MAKTSGRQEKRLKLRRELWPDADETVWTKGDPGWAPILPRIITHVAVLSNHLAPKGKGNPGATYIDLWFRTDGDSFVRVVRPDEMAYASGFSGSRAERSWAERMSVLQDLGLIRIKAEGLQQIAFVLLVHPLRAVEALLETRGDKIPQMWKTYYEARVKDMQIAPS